jgi:HD-like signal output (HDOD) protein
MKVTCQGCRKAFVVADEKIPEDKAVKVHCPVCRSVIRIRRPETGREPSAEAGAPDRLTGDALMEKILKTSKAMPPMPQILAKATRIIHDETKGFQDIAEVLETDQAMATRVLRIANSPYYGLTVPASSVRQASALLGSQTLLELITIVSTSRIMGQALTGYGFSSTSVWKHSLTVSSLSKDIADRKYPELLSDAFNAGLIHDSGMIILDEYMAERKRPGQNPSPDESELIETEKALFGFDHAEIAASFLEKWHLPQVQTKAIKYHHRPSASDGDTLSYILHAAESIAHYGPEADQIIQSAEDGTFERLALEPDEISEIYSAAVEAVEDIVAGFAQ